MKRSASNCWHRRFDITYVDDLEDQGDTPFTTHVTPGTFDIAFTTSAIGEGGGVPEPAAWALMTAGFGIAGVALRRRRSIA